MVLVDVFVPALDKAYNFSLNEEVPVSMLIEEITEVVERKEKNAFAGEREKLHLYCSGTRQQLPNSNTLLECAVGTGNLLILI